MNINVTPEELEVMCKALNLFNNDLGKKASDLAGIVSNTITEERAKNREKNIARLVRYYQTEDTTNALLDRLEALV